MNVLQLKKKQIKKILRSSDIETSYDDYIKKQRTSHGSGINFSEHLITTIYWRLQGPTPGLGLLYRWISFFRVSSVGVTVNYTHRTGTLKAHLKPMKVIRPKRQKLPIKFSKCTSRQCHIQRWSHNSSVSVQQLQPKPGIKQRLWAIWSQGLLTDEIRLLAPCPVANLTKPKDQKRMFLSGQN